MTTNHTMVKARLDDRIGVAAVTYVLFVVKLGPGLALTLVLRFAICIGWRWLRRNMPPSSRSSGAPGQRGAVNAARSRGWQKLAALGRARANAAHPARLGIPLEEIHHERAIAMTCDVGVNSR
jgi:hypothetical protein